MLRTVILILGLFVATCATAQQLPSLYRVEGVATGDVLNVRAQPSAQSEIVGALPPGTRRVEVIGLSDDGRWGWIRNQEGMGWAAMRFLAPEDAAPWHEAAAPMSCYGTEPFWSLSLDFPSTKATLRTPDSEVLLSTPVPHLPSTRFPPTLAVPFHGARNGMAVVRATLCNDGMSDRMFGFEVQVYFTDTADALSGCCQIGD
ncbi:MAG: SH3 domain-containing protein [Paracoccaceae bacterium]